MCFSFSFLITIGFVMILVAWPTLDGHASNEKRKLSDPFVRVPEEEAPARVMWFVYERIAVVIIIINPAS